MEHHTLTELAVYKKALEIFKVSRAIACNIGDGVHIFEMSLSSNIAHRTSAEIVTGSLKLAPALAEVKNSADGLNRKRRVRKIRTSIHNLLAKCSFMETSGIKEPEFILLLKKEIYQFDQLLSDWLNNLQPK